MQDLNDLFYYVQVIDHGGFAPAGRALGTPKSKLSRRIAALEQRLGVRLLQRSTRHFSVTEIGKIFYTHCQAMLVEAEAAEESIEMLRSVPCGVLRVTCPTALLDARVGVMLSKFMVKFPKVKLQLEATNRRIDVIEEGIDLAIRVRPTPLEDSDLVVRILAERSQCLVAAKPLLKRQGKPKVPADLKRFPSLSLDFSIQNNEHRWTLFGPDDAVAEIFHEPSLITSSMLTLRSAAIDAVGVTQLPLMVVSDQIASGELIRVLPDWAPRPEIVHAVFGSRRGLIPSVRALIDLLVDEFSKLDEN